ncbi:hypothetical protein HYN56_11145 [Flavobacterium crocinum]|uniref:Serine protease n=1 Tax=Flavobacterium crocinum TaxID=2183896 RepID=A0A2S1YLI7_9FLAO|nr:serine protease [Flavobacterium crocinum]AWK04748.1 hypothetical protein HYN56_11145 [Flavobacterium crocinum]
MRRYYLLVILIGTCSLNGQVKDTVVAKQEIIARTLEVFKRFKDLKANQKEYEGAIIEEIQLSIPLQQPAASGDAFYLKQLAQKSLTGDLGKEGPATLMPEVDGKNAARLTGPSQYDSRIEPLVLNSEIPWQKQILINSESVGIIVEREKLNAVSKEIYQLDIYLKLGERYNLCSGEAFAYQPVTGVGTAFISGDSTMITALHVFERPLKHYAVVFGYKIISRTGVVDVFVDKKDVYFLKEVIRKNSEQDVAEFTVDQSFNRPALAFENSEAVTKEKNEVYMIGYPSGMPLKVSLNASVTQNDNPFYFYTTLDSFQGNSGSPVFNFYTHKVIGILVSGEIDYKFNGHCNTAPVCFYPFCKGEKVVRIENVFN